MSSRFGWNRLRAEVGTRTGFALIGAAVLAASVVGAVLAVRPDADSRTVANTKQVAERDFDFRPYAAPRSLPNIAFEDEKGQKRTLADFKGKVMLLNIWATWCPPCRKEMPTLDRLQQRLGGSDFEVVALSIDRDGVPAVRKFFKEIGVRALAVYVDRNAEAGFSLGIVGVPTTLLIDRSGQEIGRLAGPAEWDSPKVMETIRRYLAPGA